MNLQDYFKKFRKNIIGIDQKFQTAYGNKKIIYLDWTSSGRLYRPIEEKMVYYFGPFVANTHTEITITSTSMTNAYKEAKGLIKKHVNAKEEDRIVLTGSGMTAAITTLQRILGLKIHERFSKKIKILPQERPVVFITHMEHHSNQTSWLETICDVEIISPDANGLVDLDSLKNLLNKYHLRKTKIASITAASNVTGIEPPVHEIAKMMHDHRGLCFVDYACSAPYVKINMHPKNPKEKLDAVFFSPHKFLGGPGASGVLIFNSNLYHNEIPDKPGGGTVVWTNPWGEHEYFKDIEEREDGGTPPFLQTIKAALSIKLKEEMGVSNILKREKEMLEKILPALKKIPGVKILAENNKDRLGVISFTVDDLHYNLVCKLLNDKFGIQTRGGCACAGTYGHYLFDINKEGSKTITNKLKRGDYYNKPGFVRLSVHPTNTDKEIKLAIEALRAVAKHGKTWGKDYSYNPKTNEFFHKYFKSKKLEI